MSHVQHAHSWTWTCACACTCGAQQPTMTVRSHKPRRHARRLIQDSRNRCSATGPDSLLRSDHTPRGCPMDWHRHAQSWTSSDISQSHKTSRSNHEYDRSSMWFRPKGASRSGHTSASTRASARSVQHLLASAAREGEGAGRGEGRARGENSLAAAVHDLNERRRPLRPQISCTCPSS